MNASIDELIAGRLPALSWRRLNCSVLALVDRSGRIVAEVVETLGGAWGFDGDSYIDLDSAKQAAERKHGAEA